jgi:hypothetical protein
MVQAMEPGMIALSPSRRVEGAVRDRVPTENLQPRWLIAVTNASQALGHGYMPGRVIISSQINQVVDER